MEPSPQASPGSTPGEVLSGLRARYYDAHNALFGVPLVIRKHVSLVQMQPGDALLDLGCGTGEAIHQIHRRFGAHSRLQGIDPSPEMLAVARRKLRRCEGASVDWGVGENLAYPPGTFHWVISCLTMHHLPLATKRQALGECHRVLKPKGRLLITDFGRPTGAVGRALARIWRGHAFTAENLDHVLYGLIAETGFSILSSAIQGGVIHHILATKS
jgi:ubiquinone/menaquinone biosynthesis C-methylase UbiE